MAETPARASISLDAASSEIDGRNNQIVLTRVTITQQGYSIRANQARANGLDFQNSRWVFIGMVELTTPDGHCTADQATVNFVDDQIDTVQISGTPATFEQHDNAQADQSTLAKGRASNMMYDLNKNTVTLTGKAWIQYGQNEFNGNSVTYDIPLRKVLAKSEDQQGERVRITINPDATTGAP
jgi:lipopolysaccharide transport protein LptA